MEQLKFEKIFSGLLAEENLKVGYWNKPTAAFDTESRKIFFPMFKNDTPSEVRSLFCIHEICHALYTPKDLTAKLTEFAAQNNISVKTAHSALNILEDARIEEILKQKLPGATKIFNDGYQEIFEDNFFGASPDELRAKIASGKMSLLDQLNLYAKLGPVTLGQMVKPEVVAFYQRVLASKSFDDLFGLAKDILEAEKENQHSPKLEEDGMSIQIPDLRSEPDFGSSDDQEESEEHESEDSETESESSESSESGPKPDKSEESEEEPEGSEASESKPEESKPEESGESEEDSNGSSNGSESESEDSEEEDEDSEENTGPSNSGDTDDERKLDESDLTNTQDSSDDAFKNQMESSINQSPVFDHEIIRSYSDKMILNSDKLYGALKDHGHDWEQLRSSVLFEKIGSYMKANKNTCPFVDVNNRYLHFNYILQYRKEVERLAGELASAFLQKQSALSLDQESNHDTGEIDINELWKVKFSSDLFLNEVRAPVGKNHNLILAVDFSGSMHTRFDYSKIVCGNLFIRSYVELVLFQSSVLVEFAKMVGIDYHVFFYGVSLGANSDDILQQALGLNYRSFRDSVVVPVADTIKKEMMFDENIMVPGLGSGPYTRADHLNETSYLLYMNSGMAHNSLIIEKLVYDVVNVSEYSSYNALKFRFRMMGTPLFPVIVAMIDVLNNSGNKKNTVIILTDGDPDPCSTMMIDDRSLSHINGTIVPLRATFTTPSLATTGFKDCVAEILTTTPAAARASKLRIATSNDMFLSRTTSKKYVFSNEGFAQFLKEHSEKEFNLFHFFVGKHYSSSPTYASIKDSKNNFNVGKLIVHIPTPLNSYVDGYYMIEDGRYSGSIDNDPSPGVAEFEESLGSRKLFSAFAEAFMTNFA